MTKNISNHRYFNKKFFRNTALITIALIVLLFFAYILFVVSFFVCLIGQNGEPHGYLKFDSITWVREGDSGVRVRMVDDLLREYRLIGLRRQDLVQILGEPDETDKFSRADIVYWLGRERGGLLQIDSEWMLVFFDGNGRVERIRLDND